jgi:hypothetical protein
VRLDPSDLGVAECPVAGRVPVERGERAGRLGDPEVEIGELPGELVEVLTCETIELVRDQVGARDRVGEGMLLYTWERVGRDPSYTFSTK